MSEWPYVRLADVADIRFSNVDKKMERAELPVRLCNYMDVYGNGGYVTAEQDFMEASASRVEIERFAIANGDVIVTKDSETPDDIGVPAVVVDDIKNLVCGYHLALIRPNRTRVHPVYLAKQLASDVTVSYFSKLANGSTRYGLSSSSIASARIPLPPLSQQSRIADVLRMLDETVGHTEALIAKYQQIKAGLMHDLFTRGITPDGHLRPSRKQSPHLYKESALGWIPREWAVGTLQDIVGPNRPIVYGILMPGITVPDGVPVVKVKDVVNGEIQTDNLLLTSREIDAEYQRSKLKADDILLTIRGTVGRLALVPDALADANITQDTARIAIVRGIAKFFRYYLETDAAKAYFAINTLGVAVQGINIRDVRSTTVPMPPAQEQMLIASRLDSLVVCTKAYVQELSKLKLCKNGLMHDLLTGRVRVGVPEAVAA